MAPSNPASQVCEDDYHNKTIGYVFSAVDRDYAVQDDEHLRHSFNSINNHCQGTTRKSFLFYGLTD